MFGLFFYNPRRPACGSPICVRVQEAVTSRLAIDTSTLARRLYVHSSALGLYVHLDVSCFREDHGMSETRKYAPLCENVRVRRIVSLPPSRIHEI